MMRAFFITACVLSLVYIVACIGIAQEVRDAKWASFESEYFSDDYYTDDYSYDYSYDDYSYYEEEADDSTRMGGIVSVLFMLISAGAFTLGLMKIKTKTMKVISIIGLSLSGLFLLWAMLPMSSPGSVSFDEVAPAFILAGLALLGLHVVGVVHAFKTST